MNPLPTYRAELCRVADTAAVVAGFWPGVGGSKSLPQHCIIWLSRGVSHFCERGELRRLYCCRVYVESCLLCTTTSQQQHYAWGKLKVGKLFVPQGFRCQPPPAAGRIQIQIWLRQAFDPPRQKPHKVPAFNLHIFFRRRHPSDGVFDTRKKSTTEAIFLATLSEITARPVRSNGHTSLAEGDAFVVEVIVTLAVVVVGPSQKVKIAFFSLTRIRARTARRG